MATQTICPTTRRDTTTRPCTLRNAGTIWTLLATAVLLAVPVAASADIDIPANGQAIGPEFRMTFTLRQGDPRPLAQDHKSKCEALGPSKCRVIQFTPDPNWGSVKLLLAPGTSSGFMASISKTTANVGFTSYDGGMGSPTQRDMGDLKLRKQLLEAQKEKLSSLQSPSSDLDRQQLLSMQASVEGQLKQVDAQMGRFGKNPATETLSINYNVEGRNRRNDLGRAVEDMGPKFLIGIVIVTAVALLTALYFGIIGLAFLWLRKFAIKRGLLKGG